jgi:hypothetical protein
LKNQDKDEKTILKQLLGRSTCVDWTQDMGNFSVSMLVIRVGLNLGHGLGRCP